MESNKPGFSYFKCAKKTRDFVFLDCTEVIWNKALCCSVSVLILKNVSCFYNNGKGYIGLVPLAGEA